jgi:hypothetical protein
LRAILLMRWPVRLYPQLLEKDWIWHAHVRN